MMDPAHFFGKRISVLGDSISTLQGYNPPDYQYFYALGQCGIKGMDDTWWGKVISTLKGTFLMNDSWAGSRVTCVPGTSRLFPSASSKERTGNLNYRDQYPDIIFIYLGVNDWLQGAPLKMSQLRRDSGFPEMFFETAYRLMLKRIRNNYPYAEIYCIPINPTIILWKPAFFFPNECFGCSYLEFNNVIRDEALKAGAYYLDTAGYGVPYESVDGIHPNDTGMNMIAENVISNILEGYRNSYHSKYVDNEECPCT